MAEKKQSTNMWDVLLALVKGLVHLADRNRIWGVVALGLITAVSILCLRMPPESIPAVLPDALNRLKEWWVWGWLLASIAAFAFWMLFGYSRRRVTEMAERIEKLERGVLGAGRPSSKRDRDNG